MKTDSELQQEILSELRWDPSVKEAHIGVEVNHGAVTLSGHVDNYLEKLNAEKAAYQVAGVKVIANEIDVHLPHTHELTDSALAASIQRLLELNPNGLPADIQIRVENGFVTIHGTTEWEYKKNNINKILRYLKGIRGISNRIQLVPHISTISVKSEIENALKRKAQIAASGIRVATETNTITLEGKVSNLQEKRLAIDTAWSTPGVVKVIDRISISPN